jgi:hypothetical protein
MEMKRAVLGAGLGLAMLTGCGEPEVVAPPPGVEVIFLYKASTERNFDIPDCGVGNTHIHPSWWDYTKVDFISYGPMEWRRLFSNVPVGERLRIRVSDPNYCDRDPNGATTENVFANGVQLTKVVSTPGNGVEPGLSLFVEEDGTVRP